MDLLFLFLFLPLSLNVSSHLLIVGNNRTNGIITSSKYLIKYLESYF